MPIPFDNTYAHLPDAFYAKLDPAPVSNPSLIRLNHDLAALLRIDTAKLDSPEGLAILAGNTRAEGSEPVATAYAGHQFGGFSPQLGDGRALLLGEVVGKDKIRRDIQLKGSGPTPFSRGGDGRSALGPVLREYIVSEAMHALGVPTTRALAAVLSGETVARQTAEPGGIFTRVATSHIRIGTFQWFASRGDLENLQVLADYAIDRHYPDARDHENPTLALLENVIAQQASLVAHWMQLGFIHGVMNTDNMSVSGETIDYGPCAFMDIYHPDKKFSSIDQHGRYAFSNQAPVAHWNLTRLAETLVPLLHDDPEQAVALANTALNKFPELHHAALHGRLTAKIGIPSASAADLALVEELLDAMAGGEADFTLTFRLLSDAVESGDDTSLTALFNTPDAITAWLGSWRTRIPAPDRPAAIALMRRTNPVYIPRNHRVEQAIQAAYTGDFAPFHKLTELLQTPFTPDPAFSEYEKPPAPHETVCATFCGT